MLEEHVYVYISILFEQQKMLYNYLIIGNSVAALTKIISRYFTASDEWIQSININRLIIHTNIYM